MNNPKRPKMNPLTLSEKVSIMNYHENLIKDGIGTSKAVVLTSLSLGIRKSTVVEVIKENRREIEGPNKSAGRQKLQLNDSAKQIIRRKVHEFYFQKEIPIVHKILISLNKDPKFPYISRSVLCRIIEDIGFKWEKHNKQSFPIEKSEIIIQRRQYLHKIKEAREGNKKIFYIDETWLHLDCRDQMKRYYTRAASEELAQPPGEKLFITHICSAEGFVEGGLFTFETENVADHEDIISDIYEEWFSQILDLIPVGSVIVMNEGGYHSRLVEELPSILWKKHDMIFWLIAKGINFPEDPTRTELYYTIKPLRNKYKKFVIDEMAKEKGMDVLRFPPYHSDLNPLEMIWVQVKAKILRKKKAFQMEDLKAALESTIANVTKENWEQCNNRVIEQELKMWEVDHFQEELCELLADTELSSSSDSEWEE